MTVRDVIIKESEVGAIPDKTETPDLLDEGSQQLGIWHPDCGHQDDGDKKEQGTSTAIKKKWHDAESVNTQEMTLRREVSDVEEAALDEESTATRGSLRDSESLEDSKMEDFSQPETVGFFEEELLEQADRAELRRGTRKSNDPQSVGEISTRLAVTECDNLEPKTVYEAKHGDDRDQWHRETKYEVKTLQDNETWSLVRAATDKDVIPGKWVYKVKLGPSGQLDKNKARYVAKSFKQMEGLDYFENLRLPVSQTFRILLQLASKQGHVMLQFDVKTAFLHSRIEEEVHLEQPLELAKQGSDGEKLACRHNKSIYRLKQTANNWYKDLANLLLRQGFTRSRNNHCLFARAEGHTFILVWVDDITLATRSMTVISDVKKQSKPHFTKKTGRIHWFLSLGIRREEGKVTVDQERYIETMLERFQVDQCKHSRFPADLNLKLHTAQNRRRSGPEDLQKLCWITSVSGQTDEARHHVHSQHSVHTHDRINQSTLDVLKKTSAISSRIKSFKTYLQKRS